MANYSIKLINSGSLDQFLENREETTHLNNLSNNSTNPTFDLKKGLKND